MSDYKPQKGDRVRVVVEGEITGTYREGQCFNIGHSPGGMYVTPHTEHVVSVEKLEPPVEVFGPGDIVRPKDIGHIVYMLGRNHYSYVYTGPGEGEVIRARFYDTERFTSERYEKVNLG